MNESFSDRSNLVATGWYGARAKPKPEKQDEQNIEFMGVEYFLPLLLEEKIVSCGRRKVCAPFFSGYLFDRFNLPQRCGMTYA